MSINNIILEIEVRLFCIIQIPKTFMSIIFLQKDVCIFPNSRNKDVFKNGKNRIKLPKKRELNVAPRTTSPWSQYKTGDDYSILAPLIS